MSAPSTTQVATLNPTARFAAYVKTLTEESVAVRTSYETAGLSLELAEKAIGLDFCVRSAFKQLAKEQIRDPAQLYDLCKARFHLISSQLISNQTPALSLQSKAGQILEGHNPKEILSGEHIQDCIPKVYEQMAALVGTGTGEKSVIEHGKALFEDDAQDRATKAQALINVANEVDFLRPQELEGREKLYIQAGKADKVYAEAMHSYRTIAQQTLHTGLLACAVLGSRTAVVPTETINIPETLSEIGNLRVMFNFLGENFEKSSLGTTLDNLQSLTVIQPTKVEEPEPVQTEAPVKVEEPKPVQTEVPVKVEEPEPIQTEAPVKVEKPAPISEVQTTKVDKTDPVETEEDIELEAVRKQYQELRAINSSLDTNLGSSLKATSSTSPSDNSKIFLRAENELFDDAQVPAQPSQQEKLAQEEAACVVEVSDAEADFLQIQEKIAANQVTIDKENAVQVALAEKYRLALQEIEKIKEVKNAAQKELEHLKNAGVDLQQSLAGAKENAKAAQEWLARVDAETLDIEKLSKEPNADKPLLTTQLKEKIAEMQKANTLIALHYKAIEGFNAQIDENQQAIAKEEKNIALLRNSIVVAEGEMFDYPMQITDVQVRLKNVEDMNAKLVKEAAAKNTALLKAKEKHVEIHQRLEASKLPNLLPSSGSTIETTVAGTQLVKEKLPLTVDERAKQLQLIHDDLLDRSFWKNPSETDRSGIVMEKIIYAVDQGMIDAQDQLMIKEYIIDFSKDPGKTRENNWIESHIGDNLEILYLAFEEIIKRIKS